MNRQTLIILAGIAASPIMVQQVLAQNPNFFPKARQSLVLIQNTAGVGQGTGFIVARDSNTNTYYALTAGHVVRSGQFQIRTEASPTGVSEVKPVVVLPLLGADLALLQFTSDREYSVLEPARNATGVVETNRVFVLGYPGSGSGSPEIPGGGITSRRPSSIGSGLGIFHDVKTEAGMSGSPILTNNGEVIGVHIGLRDRNSFPEGVPIEKYWELAPAVFTQAGRDNLAAGNFREAIGSLELVNRLFGQGNPEATTIIAYAYFGLGDIGRARQEAEKVNNNANTSLLLAAIGYLDRNYARAIENANRASELDRRNLGGYAFSILGLSQIATQSNNDAGNSINTASTILRDDAFVYLANSCFKFKVLVDRERAFSDFNNANRFSSQRPGNPFLAVLSPKLQEVARTCLPPEFGTGGGVPERSNPYKSSEPINLGVSVTSLAVSNDSRLVAVGLRDGNVSIYDIQTKRNVASFSSSQGSSSISSIAFSPNGQDIAIASTNGQVKVFDTRNRNEKYGFANLGDFPKVIFSNNSNLLFVSSISGTLRRVNNRTGEIIEPSVTNTHPDGITSLTLSPTGLLVSGGADGKIRFWNSSDLTPLNVNYQAHQSGVQSLAFSADGSRIISIGGKEVKSCNWQNNECIPVASSDDEIGSLAVASSGHIAFSNVAFLILSENPIFLQNLKTGQTMGNLPNHTDRVTALAYTPDGRYLISGSADKTIIIWEVQ